MIFAAGFIALLPACEKSDETIAAHIDLFNGKDLSGWNGDKKWWSVEEGMIVGRNQEEVPSSTYLFTEKKYREFRLLLEVKQTVGKGYSTMHSAVCVLGEQFSDAGENDHGFKGPLVMFCHDWGIWDAYRRNRIVPPGHKGNFRPGSEVIGEWNEVEVLVVGNRIRCVANGEMVFDFTDEAANLQESPIGLQLHKNKQPQEFRFRNIRIEEKPGDVLRTLKIEG